MTLGGGGYGAVPESQKGAALYLKRCGDDDPHGVVVHTSAYSKSRLVTLNLFSWAFHCIVIGIEYELSTRFPEYSPFPPFKIPVATFWNEPLLIPFTIPIHP